MIEIGTEFAAVADRYEGYIRCRQFQIAQIVDKIEQLLFQHSGCTASGLKWSKTDLYVGTSSTTPARDSASGRCQRPDASIDFGAISLPNSTTRALSPAGSNRGCSYIRYAS